MSDTTIDQYYALFAKEESEKVAKANAGAQLRPEFLKLEKGNKIKLRLIPNISKQQLFKTYEQVMFRSKKDNSFRFLGRSPSDPSLGDSRLKKDPIKEAQWKSYQLVKGGTKEEIKESMALMPKRKEMVNVYVISDQKNPDNNGTVKIFDYNAPLKKEKVEGKNVTSPTGEIYKKIYDAFAGEKKDRYGAKLIDLSPNGMTIEIVIGSKGEYNSYEVDFFQEDLHLDAETRKGILAKTFDLDEFLPKLKDLIDINKELDEHYWQKSVDETSNFERDLPSEDDDDQLDFSLVSGNEKKNSDSNKTFEWNEDDNAPTFDD